LVSENDKLTGYVSVWAGHLVLQRV